MNRTSPRKETSVTEHMWNCNFYMIQTFRFQTVRWHILQPYRTSMNVSRPIRLKRSKRNIHVDTSIESGLDDFFDGVALVLSTKIDPCIMTGQKLPELL